MTRSEFQVQYAQGPDALYGLFQQMEQTIAAMSVTVQTLEQTVANLTARIHELEGQLKKDSHNSSKPPSSDGYKRKPVSLRTPSGKKPGGQAGHPGATLCLSDSPNPVIPHAPETCSFCGTSLSGVPASGHERHQVYDLPPLSLQVTEHQAETKRCPHCQTQTAAAFPEGVTQTVQYGPDIKALLVYLHTFQLLPYERIGNLVSDLFGACPSEGTLFTSLGTAFEALAPVEAAIQDAVTRARVAGFDETGCRIMGKLHWLHTATTGTLTFYGHHEKRGREAMDALSVLPGFTGTAMHDAFSSYFGYTGCDHALCNAHLLRELIFVKGLPEQPWSAGMLDLLIEIKHAVDAARNQGQGQLTPESRNDFTVRYDRLVQEGLACSPKAVPTGKRGRTKQTPAYNLLVRLKTHKVPVLRFMDRFDIPFDNNQSERDLRMMKVKQKVSGCFRSQVGASFFCRIRGYIATLRKQGVSLLPALQSVFTGNPVMPILSG